MSPPAVRLRNPARTACCTRAPGGTARRRTLKEGAIVPCARSRSRIGLPESLKRRRCRCAGAREVFLPARVGGTVQQALTGCLLGRLRGRGDGPHEDQCLEPLFALRLARGAPRSALGSVLSALLRALAVQRTQALSRFPASARTRLPGRPFISSIVSTHPFTPFLLPLGGLSIPRTPPPKLSVLNLSQRRRRGRGRGRPPRWLRAPGSSVSRRKTQEGALGPALCTSGAATGRRKGKGCLCVRKFHLDRGPKAEQPILRKRGRGSMTQRKEMFHNASPGGKPRGQCLMKG
ncbi:uncharacterized protein LOC110256366 [Sus scrofa]|uniref:uncharacterized protein LOC110256366 n=1 Tax=Sus scrofa TaxID=9823 RepID=UPI000A2B51CB|nr:uncharacterized protein LOC110256366 [Sus scrofa]